MSVQHRELAAGRWRQMPLTEQMANVASEVERALAWRARGRAVYSQQAFERALELMDLTLAEARGLARRRELARAREVLVDYFAGANAYQSSEASLRNYFAPFACAWRRGA